MSTSIALAQVTDEQRGKRAALRARPVNPSGADASVRIREVEGRWRRTAMARQGAKRELAGGQRPRRNAAETRCSEPDPSRSLDRTLVSGTEGVEGSGSALGTLAVLLIGRRCPIGYLLCHLPLTSLIRTLASPRPCPGVTCGQSPPLQRREYNLLHRR